MAREDWRFSAFVAWMAAGLAISMGGAAIAQDAQPKTQIPLAAQKPSETQEPSEPQEDPEDDWSFFDLFHARVAGSVSATAGALDDLFADEEFEVERNDSSLRLRFDSDYDSEDGFSFAARPVLRLRMPGTRRTLLLEARALADPGDPPLRDRPSEQLALAEQEDDFGFEVDLRLLEDYGRFSVSPEVGLQVDGYEPHPYGGGRLRVRWEEVGPWTFQTSERLRAYSDRGLESFTRAQADRLVFTDTLLRVDADLLWRADDASRLQYGSGANLFFVIDEDSAVALGGKAVFDTEVDETLSSVTGALRYRQRVWTDWTTVELSPRIIARQADDMEPSFGALVRLEVEF